MVNQEDDDEEEDTIFKDNVEVNVLSQDVAGKKSPSSHKNRYSNYEDGEEEQQDIFEEEFLIPDEEAVKNPTSPLGAMRRLSIEVSQREEPPKQNIKESLTNSQEALDLLTKDDKESKEDNNI